MQIQWLRSSWTLGERVGQASDSLRSDRGNATIATSVISIVCNIQVKVKVRQTLYRPITCPKVSRRLRQISRRSAHEGGKVISHTHRQPLPPRKYSWHSFLLEAELTSGPQCGRMSIKNSNDTKRNRTRDLPACTAVPQLTAPLPTTRYPQRFESANGTKSVLRGRSAAHAARSRDSYDSRQAVSPYSCGVQRAEGLVTELQIALTLAQFRIIHTEGT